MIPEVKYIFTMLDTADVSITDLSKLTTITRQALHAWKNGSVLNPAPIRVRMAYSVAKRLERAVAADKLPLTGEYAQGERFTKLKDIILESAQ